MTQTEDLSIACQNLIDRSREFKANFLFFWCLYQLVFDLELLELVLNIYAVVKAICYIIWHIKFTKTKAALEYVIDDLKSPNV